MAEQYSELRERIAKLGMTQTGLARRMRELGDDRDEKNILRSIQRMIAGDARVSGEMRAMLGMMELCAVAPAKADRPAQVDRVEVRVPIEDIDALHAMIMRLKARAALGKSQAPPSDPQVDFCHHK